MKELTDIFESNNLSTEIQKEKELDIKISFETGSGIDKLSKKNVRKKINNLDKVSLYKTGAAAGDIVGGPTQGNGVSKAISGARFLLLSKSEKGKTGQYDC